MKWLAIACCLLVALVVVPVYVHWLRHRPHRLTQGTQHIVLAGLAIQICLFAVMIAIWLLA
jgi:hypothetical protein